MSLDDNIALNNVRALLRIHEEHGLLDTVADTARLPVWLLRNWLNDAAAFPEQEEFDKIRRALVQLHNYQSRNQAYLFGDAAQRFLNPATRR